MNQILDETPRHKFETALKDFISLFIKIFGIRAVYSILQYIIGNKNNLKIKTIKSFLQIFIGSNLYHILVSLLLKIFSWSNFRTSLSISMIPFIYKLLKLAFKTMYGMETYPNLTTFIFGLIASFSSIIIEEKTKFAESIMISIMIRVLHLIILMILKKFDILQNTGRNYDYFSYLMSTSGIWALYFFNPQYKPISNYIQKCTNYTSKESYEYLADQKFLNMFRLV